MCGAPCFAIHNFRWKISGAFGTCLWRLSGMRSMLRVMIATSLGTEITISRLWEKGFINEDVILELWIPIWGHARLKYWLCHMNPVKRSGFCFADSNQTGSLKCGGTHSLWREGKYVVHFCSVVCAVLHHRQWARQLSLSYEKIAFLKWELSPHCNAIKIKIIWSQKDFLYRRPLNLFTNIPAM